jgi:hypothetical protein
MRREQQQAGCHLLSRAKGSDELSLPFTNVRTFCWWTRPDSNRRSPACKAGAFPLGHGPRTIPDFRQSIVPTRGFEPPHPEGQQILSLSRLPIPPRRHPLTIRTRWDHTPDSVFSPCGQDAVICLIPTMGWQLLTCRVLPDLVVAAATRPKSMVETNAPSPAHSPCSQSHARPAGRVSKTAGGLLPHRFAPYRPS